MGTGSGVPFTIPADVGFDVPATPDTPPTMLYGITDRMRFTVIEANTDAILTRDLVVKSPNVTTNLSGPSTIEFSIPQGEQEASSFGIDWKNWGQLVVAELGIAGIRQVFAYGIVTDNKADPATGDMKIECTGVINYPKGIPFLADYNPIAVDPFEIVQRVWAHLEGFSNASLNVTPEPASSGTQMLPGYSFDGSSLNFDFFAVFYRAIDMEDCQDIIAGLARDIPFDMIEEASWDSDRTVLTRTIHLGYPQAGLQQDSLTFRLGENVIQAEKAEEMDIQPVSDVIIRGWLPGTVYSAELSNEDPTRYRRTIMEEDAMIDSTERAAAWAKRKLTRRNIPLSFSKILIDPNHPSAPIGSFGLGDSIWVSAENYPWYGTIEGYHRITSMTYTEAEGKQNGQQSPDATPAGLLSLGLKVDGAFNYDPIEYDPDYASQPVTDPNRLSNGYFSANLSGWTSVAGQWIRTADVTYANDYDPDTGSVRIDCDDHGEAFLSHRATVTPGEFLTVEAAVQWEDITSTVGVPGFILRGFTSLNGDGTVGETIDFESVVNPTGVGGWVLLKLDNWHVPDGINELALQFTVDESACNGGTAWWTFARIYPTGFVVTPVAGQ